MLRLHPDFIKALFANELGDSNPMTNMQYADPLDSLLDKKDVKGDCRFDEIRLTNDVPLRVELFYKKRLVLYFNQEHALNRGDTLTIDGLTASLPFSMDTTNPYEM